MPLAFFGQVQAGFYKLHFVFTKNKLAAYRGKLLGKNTSSISSLGDT
jgi:hypothetical protein